jgi:hypothetical protein
MYSYIVLYLPIRIHLVFENLSINSDLETNCIYFCWWIYNVKYTFFINYPLGESFEEYFFFTVEMNHNFSQEISCDLFFYDCKKMVVLLCYVFLDHSIQISGIDKNRSKFDIIRYITTLVLIQWSCFLYFCYFIYFDAKYIFTIGAQKCFLFLPYKTSALILIV